MNKREKILVAVVTVLVLLAVGRIGWRAIGNWKQDRLDRLAAVEKQLRERQVDWEYAKRAAAKLAAWQRRSLPANRTVAHGLYKQWLVDQLAPMSNVNVTSTTTVARAGSQQQITFTVRGRATLEQLVKFLYAFYRADHLHKLQSFSFVPVKDSDQLELSFAIEALALAGADHIDTLSSATSTRLAHDELAPYLKAVAGRNLFAHHVPTKPSGEQNAEKEQTEANAKRESARKDLAGQICVTALITDGQNPQVWLNVRTTGQLFVLHPGEQFAVEDLSGTISSIHFDPREVIIATDGKKLRVALGGNLGEGTVVGDSGG